MSLHTVCERLSKGTKGGKGATDRRKAADDVLKQVPGLMTQILANPPENAPLLIRGLAMFNHHERDDLTKDPTKKRTPAVLSRMRSAADALSQFVRCTIDWIECAGHPKTATFALASSHGMEPTDAATALAKTLVRDVVPHCLASLEHGNDFFAPFANAYLHMLCDIASSYVVRGVLDDAQRLGLSDLCMRHLLPRPVKTERSMDLDDPLSNFGSSSSNSVVGQSARIAALSTLFSRLLLIHPRPLLVDVRRLFEFFVTFFGRRLSGPALPPDMVGALNFVLLRTVNSASEVILPYVTQLMPFMASHLVSSEIERLRREILVFFRIAFFVSLGESLDTDRTKDAVNSLGECVRIGWRHLMQSMERGNPSAFTPLDSSEWTLGWPTPSSDLGASTTPHPTAPFSPLFAGTLNLGVAASFSEKSRPLSSWNGLWVAAELFVRQRQLEGAAVSEHPLEAPGEIEPPSATRRRRLTTLEELLHVLSIHKRDKEDVTQVLTCQVLTFVTLRYPTAWSDFEIAQIMLALTEVLNTTNHPDVLHWACIAVATFFELPAPPAGSADPLNHSPVARISDIVLRRMSKPFCNPIFHLLLAIRIHAQRLNLQDASVVTVDPKSAFSGDTAPQPAVLRYAIYLAATDAGVWASLEWRDDALVWLFRDPQSWAAAVSADPQAVSAFLQMLAGSFGSALQLAARTHTAPLFPTDATIAEHELLGFTVAGTILFDGELPRPFTPVDAAPRLAALAREAFIHVAMCEKVLEQLQTVTAALAADATASVSLASPVAVSTLRIAADFLQFSIEQQIFEPARLELHPTFLATKDLAAACANLLPAALPEKDTQQQALFAHLKALLWVFGLTSVRFPRYFGIHLSATNIEFDTGAIATNVLYSSSINASLVDMMTKVQGYVAHMSPGKYFVLSAAQGRGATAAMDHEFQVAATQSRTRPTSLLAASFHTCSDRVTRPKQLIGHAAALLVLTYLTAGKRSVLFPYADEKKLGLVVLALAVQLVGAPTPLLDLVIDYITSSPELLTPHLANWLFWEAWELLQVTKRDSVLGAECVSLVRPTIPLIAANEDHQNIVEYSADLGDFISFFLDRCVRTFVDHHFKTVVIKFVVAALQHRISIASTEQTKFLTCLRALANDKLASVQLDLIQLLPTILGVATTFADLTMVLDSVRPMLPQQPSSEPDAMDTSHPQVSFEAYVVPILFHTQLVISLQYHRAESIADLYHVLGECEHACDPHVVMNTIATSTGFTLSEFLDLHIPSVLFTLVERGGDVITKHPSLEALTFEPYERYLVKYAGAILTAQLFCLKFDDAAQLATALNTTLPTLIAKHFVLIFSGILPKHFVHDMAAQDVAAFIKEQLTEATFHQLYQRYKDEIAKVVILRTRDNIFSPQLLFGGAAATDLDTTDIRATYTKMLQDLPPPTPCYFSRDLPEHSTTLCIQALHHIASGFETDLAHVVTAPIALSTLAMVFHRLRSSAKDVHEHAHWVHILRLVVALMSPSTRRQPFLFRFMVNSLVQTMAASPEQHALALVLNIICVEQTSFSHSPFLLGHAIPAICTILTAATTQPKVQTILSGLVGSLLSAHESYELTDLRHLPPFQDHELLRPFTAIRDALLARWRLRERPRDLIHYMNLMPDNYAIRKQLSERVRVQVSAIDALDLATAVLSRPRLTPEDVDMIGAIYPALLAIPTNSTKSRDLRRLATLRGGSAWLSSVKQPGSDPAAARANTLAPLDIVVHHMLTTLEDFSDARSLHQCALLVGHIPAQEVSTTALSPEDLAIFQGICPTTVPAFQANRSVPDVLPRGLTDLASWGSANFGSAQEWLKNRLPLLMKYQPSYLLYRAGELCLSREPLANALFLFALASFAAVRSEHLSLINTALAGIFENYECEDTGVLQLCLNAVLHLRVLQRGSATLEPGVPELQLNWLAIAHAAFKCGRVHEAIAFAEKHKTEAFGSSAVAGARRITQRVQAQQQAANAAANDLLVRVYADVDDPDGLWGVNTEESLHHVKSTFIHEGNWFRVMGLYELQLAALPASGAAADRHEAYRGCMDAFQQLGFHHTLAEMLAQRSTASATLNVTDEQYDVLWRNQRWDLSPTPIGRLGFHGHAFEMGKALATNNLLSLDQWVKSAKSVVAESLSVGGDGSGGVGARDSFLFLQTPAKHDSLLHAHVLSNMSLVLRALSDSARATATVDSSGESSSGGFNAAAFSMWTGNAIVFEDALPFEKHDELLSLRSALLGALKPPSSLVLPELMHHSRIARKAERFQAAANLLSMATTAATSAEERWSISHERAKLHWQQDDVTLALRILDGIITAVNPAPTPAILARALKWSGKWRASTRLESARSIFENYLNPAASYSPGNGGIRLALARCAHDQFTSLQAGETIAHLRDQIATNQAGFSALRMKAQTLRQGSEEYRSLQIRLARINGQVKQDTEELKIEGDMHATALSTAIENYLHVLYLTSRNDLVIYALCSLWMANSQSNSATQSLAEHFMNVPAHKFLCVANLLTARLGSPTDPPAFQAALYSLVERLLKEHPHHMLYHLIALRNAEVTGYTTAFVRTPATDPGILQRMQAVTKLLHAFATTEKELWQQYSTLAEAYIELSYSPVPQGTGTNDIFIRESKLVRLRDMVTVPITTFTLDPRLGIDLSGGGGDQGTSTQPQMSSASQSQYPAKSQRYSGPPTIARFEDKVMVPGGINQPKRVACIGSNGKVYKQLVKGNDDLRQDAGLMHVFSVTDALLARHAPTRQRKLGIRTYKVVPLAPQAGLLEWVDHTIPLVNVYAQQFDKRPVINGVKQLKAADARAMLGRISTQSRRSKYMMMRDQILPKFQPVFRHWFLAQPDAETWFRKRLAYSRSCAASSIIGWVVGLGDRHTSNILFDEKTAELVHIDLGISFDAGKALPIPETVPFRLTQNMVDGLGPSGLDGVFRRCCQETYRVLRAEAPVLYTILEVFKADPLHSWSDPQKLARAAHRGGDEGGSGGEPALRTSRAAAASASHGGGSGGSAASSENNEAARALRGVRRKLEARETVECKVNELIQDATSVENLAQIFCGWMPFV